MKYIIKESRLDELVQNFITSQVGLLESHSSPTFGHTYIWYNNLNGVMLFEISDTDYHGVGLGVLESMWNVVKGMFSLSDNDTDKAFIVQNNALKAGTELFRIQENGNIGIGAVTASATLHVSGANMIFDIPSKASGYVLQSDTNGYASWVSPGSVAVFPYTGSALISGSLIVTGSINVNGSITGSLQGTASYASNSDLLDGKDSSTFATTGSNTYIGNQNVTGSLGINGSLTEYIVTSSLGAGATTVFQRVTGSFTSALAKYTINKSTNARAGEFMTVWNGNEIVNADISTTDIGSTAEVGFTSSLVNGQIQTNIVTSTSGWTAKMLITYL